MITALPPCFGPPAESVLASQEITDKDTKPPKCAIKRRESDLFHYLIVSRSNRSCFDASIKLPTSTVMVGSSGVSML